MGMDFCVGCDGPTAGLSPTSANARSAFGRGVSSGQGQGLFVQAVELRRTSPPKGVYLVQQVNVQGDDITPTSWVMRMTNCAMHVQNL